MENREYYETIQSYFKERKKEEQTEEAILTWSMGYLQLLLSGMRQQKTEPVEEATEQIGYVKRVCERYLSSRDTYTNIAYLAGVMVGEARVGSAWIREQMMDDDYHHNMKILLTKAHVKDIIETIYHRQGIQHKDLAKQVGIKPNYLSQLIMQLEEVQCVRSFRAGKCTYYELTIRGNEYIKEESFEKLFKT